MTETNNGWISVKDRLPEHDFEDVLVCLHDVRTGCEDDYFYAEACMVRRIWSMTLYCDTENLEVVAWMLLPEPPKMEDEK